MDIRKLNVDVPDDEALIPIIQQAIAHEPRLSFRSIREVRQAYLKGEIWGYFKKSQLVSFVFCSSLGGGFDELNALFTFPKFRKQGYGDNLVDYLLSNQSRQFLITTFFYSVKTWLIRKGFSEIAFSSLLFKVRIGFLLRRLKLRRLISIINHFKQGRPVYLVKYVNK